MEGTKTTKWVAFAGAALALALFAGCSGQDAAQKAQAAATQAASSAQGAEAAANSAQQSAAAAQAAATRTEQAAADAKAAADRAEAIAMKTEGGGEHHMHHHIVHHVHHHVVRQECGCSRARACGQRCCTGTRASNSVASTPAHRKRAAFTTALFLVCRGRGRVRAPVNRPRQVVFLRSACGSAGALGSACATRSRSRWHLRVRRGG